MAPRISDLIQRASSRIDDLIPYNAYELITDAARTDYSFEEQVRMVEELVSPADLLLRPRARYRLLSVLSESEAASLLRHLGVTFPERGARAALASIATQTSDEVLNGIFRWFGVERPKEEAEVPERQELPFADVVAPSYGLYPYQRDALNKIDARFRAHVPRIMLHMPTGAGKTRTAMAFVCQYLRKNENGLVIWLADTFELFEQARNEFIRSWSRLGDRELPVFSICGEVKEEKDYSRIRRGFVVLMLQSAAAALRREEKTEKETLTKLAIQRPLVIFDEAHKVMAEKYFNVFSWLSMLEGAHALGLSATPGRTTGQSDANANLVRAFSGEKVTLEVPGYPSAIAYLEAKGYLARPEFRPVDSKFDFSIFKFLVRGDTSAAVSDDRLKEIEEAVGNDPERTLLVLQEALRLIKSGHKRILLFAASVQQAHRLAFALQFFGAAGRSDMRYEARAVSSSETSPAERHAAVDWFLESAHQNPTPKVLANYGILTTGFDAPETSAVLIARPTNSLVLYSQMVGRGLRGIKSGGTPTCEIVTIVDKNLPAFWNVQAAFANWEDDWEQQNV